MYEIYKTVTNTSGIFTIKVQDAYQDTAPMAIIEAETTSLTNGDSIEIYLGYVGDYNKSLRCPCYVYAWQEPVDIAKKVIEGWGRDHEVGES